LAGIEILLEVRERDPFAGCRAGISRGKFEILWIVVAIRSGVETQLNGRRRSIVDGDLELRFGTGLEPDKAADADAHKEDDANDERPQTPQILLK